MTRPWEQFLSLQDVAALQRSPKFDRDLQSFCRRPALLMIDFFRAAFGDRPVPMLEAIEEWPSSCGLAGWETLPRTQMLLERFRQLGLPIVHTTGIVEGEIKGQHSNEKPPSGTPVGEKWLPPEIRYEIIPEVTPLPGETVIRKISSSAFWGTPLVGHLVSKNIDTLIVCGESTSGCVRSTVVDAKQFCFEVVVVEDCVFDRHETTHALNLFDMHRKFGDVVPHSEVMDFLSTFDANRSDSELSLK